MILSEIIRQWVTFAADICILFITIYTFHLTVTSNKISFNTFSESMSNNNGNGLSIVVKNKSLSPIVIEAVYLIINNEYKIEVREFKNPFILESFTAQRIESNRYSYTIPDLSLLHGKNLSLEIKTPEKNLHIRLNKSHKKIKRKMKNVPCNITKITNTYNGKIVPKNAEFALTVFKGNWYKTIFIFKNGVMTDEILGFNGLTEAAVENKKMLLDYLNNWLEPYGINYYVDKLED